LDFTAQILFPLDPSPQAPALESIRLVVPAVCNDAVIYPEVASTISCCANCQLESDKRRLVCYPPFTKVTINLVSHILEIGQRVKEAAQKTVTAGAQVLREYNQ